MMKNRFRTIAGVLSIASCILFPGMSYGANESAVNVVFNALKSLNSERLSYRYVISLTDAESKQPLDVLEGCLRKDGVLYIDSNRLMVNMRDRKYTVQVHNLKHCVYVKSIANLEQRTHTKLDGNGNTAFDLSNIRRENIVSIRTTADVTGRQHTLVRLRDLELEEITISMEKDKLHSLTLAYGSSSFQGQRMRRSIVVHNILTSGNFPIDISTYLKRAGKDFLPQGSIADYTVVELI